MTNTSDIESQVNIVDLVSRYTKLKKAGVNYKALCPFPGHNEKSPSFVVSPAKQLGYCFGCHKGGGPIKFIMDIENIEFREALQILGNIAGVKVNNYDEKTEKIIKNSYSLYKDANNYYRSTIQKYPKILEYCFNRGITEEDLKSFNIGFSDSGLELFNYLKDKNYDNNIITESNIFVDIKLKKDKFLNRLIFPIQNQRGDIIAFAGRVLDNSLPKYINSPASKVYDKSSILYGLFQARNEITKKDFVIITEGYMDVIALHRAGYINTVCVSGTALTVKHITMLKRLTKKLYLCFDSDKAGMNATELSIELLKNKGLEVKIISINGGKDPDEALKLGDNFDYYISSALSPIGFLIEKTIGKYDINSIEEKKKFLTLLLDILKSYSDNIEKDFYLKEIAKKLEIDKDIVYLEFNKLRTKREDFINTKVIQKKEYSAEEYAIGYILNNKNLKTIFNEGLIFKEDLSTDLQKIINSDCFLEKLDIDKRDRLNAIALKVEEINNEKNLEVIKIETEKLISRINLFIYKKKREILLINGEQEKFVELLRLAKEHNIK